MTSISDPGEPSPPREAGARSSAMSRLTAAQGGRHHIPRAPFRRRGSPTASTLRIHAVLAAAAGLREVSDRPGQAIGGFPFRYLVPPATRAASAACPGSPTAGICCYSPTHSALDAAGVARPIVVSRAKAAMPIRSRRSPRTRVVTSPPAWCAVRWRGLRDSRPPRPARRRRGRSAASARVGTRRQTATGRR